MADPSKFPDISTLSVSDPVLRADKQAEILQRFSLIADRIRPKLTVDGANFNTWSKSMVHNWSMCFLDDIDYFDRQERDTNYRRNLIALSFIRNSVERSLYDSIIARLSMPNARSVYQAIKKRFNKVSWSSIIHHANVIFNPKNHVDDMVQHVININESIEAIESQIGTLDSSKIITFSLLFSLPDLQERITSALDTRLAANPTLAINAEDILDIVQQMRARSNTTVTENTMHLSRITASTSGPKGDQSLFTPNQTPHQHHSKSVSPISKRSEEWKRQWLTPKNPCFYCGEAGHWAPECPARLKAANARLSSSQRRAKVATIGAIPLLENEEALLDSGAMHSVVGDISLFNSITRTDMNLAVASSHQFPVDAIGDITLMTPQGRLFIKNVLLFRPLCQTAVEAISDIPPPINLLTRPCPVVSNDVNDLWHRRLGHLSIRNVKRLLQFKAADGIPNIPFDNIKICHPCSIAKAEHRPYMSPSREHITQPGDMIAADLIGPLPLSTDNKKFALVIQDLFSRLTAVIPLHDKSEAKHQLRLWILRFSNATNFKVWGVRTDNGVEFCNHFFDDFLKEKGIIHELSIPYEHHQNGQIKRTNRTISEISRTILIAANIPSTLWPFAFKHAVWIFNRTLHANSKMTPYEIVGSKKPSLHQLRVFGAKAYIFNHQLRKDLSAKGIVGFHLGVTPDSKGWLFWVPERQTVIRSASVKFDENKFFQREQYATSIMSAIHVSL
ncbi:hypothetical protein O181_075113 [Austropuccinia psidii MF-1]|uniref:Integrase catalytic domain-containing protein n=1 Tax=Austropuccinia psidii MF-1 TaxID=1389203 RepID=A0A9Q3F887_9BASI|nr:hypothetical protein [Austropuccinia psidii MF-1]